MGRGWGHFTSKNIWECPGWEGLAGSFPRTHLPRYCSLVEMFGIWGVIPAVHSVIGMLTKQHRKFFIGLLCKRELGPRTRAMVLMGLETQLCAAASGT